MENREGREIWGVLGGMGPLASAEFVRTIYEESGNGPEQEAPIVFLLSDPSIPDRTECLLGGREDLLLERFSGSVGQLIELGATRIVIACFTIHPLIPRLPESWRRKIVSLVDIAMNCVLTSRRKHLLLCSSGAMALGLFQKHELWGRVKEQIVLVNDKDQFELHKMIYEIKGIDGELRHIRFVEGLLARYGVSSYIAGCTELHILAKTQQRASGRDRREFCIDPLTEVCSLISRTSTTSPAAAAL